MTHYVNDSGTWKILDTNYVNDSGTWKPGVSYVNDSGTWKEVIAQPSSDFHANDTTPDTETTVYFYDDSTASECTIESWDWDFGDGYSSTSQNPSHTYTSTGTYDVTLTITDQYGRTSTETKYNYIDVEKAFDYSTNIGAYTDGGYNAGTISYNSNTYAIIVAPGTNGEDSNLGWSSDTETEYGCTDSDDGVSNTDCMLNNDTTLSSGTATNFIDGIQTNGINGYNDWYIPAANELELMYNNMYNADLSGTDWDNDGESFKDENYWSSTEYSSTKDMRLSFSLGGDVFDGTKQYTFYVRSVRRVQL